MTFFFFSDRHIVRCLSFRHGAHFRAASAEAAKKFHPGYQFIIKFEDWISNPAVECSTCGLATTPEHQPYVRHCSSLSCHGAAHINKRTLFGAHTTLVSEIALLIWHFGPSVFFLASSDPAH